MWRQQDLPLPCVVPSEASDRCPYGHPAKLGELRNCIKPIFTRRRGGCRDAETTAALGDPCSRKPCFSLLFFGFRSPPHPPRLRVKLCGPLFRPSPVARRPSPEK